MKCIAIIYQFPQRLFIFEFLFIFFLALVLVLVLVLSIFFRNLIQLKILYSLHKTGCMNSIGIFDMAHCTNGIVQTLKRL